MYVEHVATTDDAHQCDTGEPQHTLHVTSVHFVNNTAHYGGGNILIWDNSSVCNQINISNSSIIGGQAKFGGGIYFQMGIAWNMDHTERKWKDSEHCNTRVTRVSEKRWTIWNCNI